MNDDVRESRQTAREQLSMLTDGELSAEAAAKACARWRDDADARATWHAYHLIGDVLRSQDLAHPRGAAFVTTLRKRLAHEPIVLAPATRVDGENVSKTQLVQPRRYWRASAAVAGSFAAVACVAIFTRTATQGPSVDVAAVRPAVTQTVATVAALPASTLMSSATADAPTQQPQRLIRDPRIDRYLSAHKEFAGSTAIGGFTAAYVRDASTGAAGR